MDRPILFSGPMVRALLDGRKTQTRRVATFVQETDGLFHIRNSGGGVFGVSEDRVPIVAPDYAPYSTGDRLWVREAFTDLRVYGGGPDVLYRVDGGPDYLKWKPGIHMPRGASRLTLTVTDVRVQRLQEISEEDAQAEGVELVYYEGSNPEYLGQHGYRVNHH